MIDILEFEIPKDILEILLKDRTTGKNILWGTDQYGYAPDSPIELEQIISGDVIKPRVLKTQAQQKSRTDSKAEVFTSLEIVKKMNDQVDEKFEGKDEDYIYRKVLEVTCGEAPYLVSRYDAATGREIFLSERQGLLDRKMRKVNDMILTRDSVVWYIWANEAVIATYGYEWQGDSLLLARENILYDVVDWYEEKFKEIMPHSMLKKIAESITYNIIQMDGVTMNIPYSDIPAKIKNWDTDEMERFDGKPEELALF